MPELQRFRDSLIQKPFPMMKLGTALQAEGSGDHPHLQG